MGLVVTFQCVACKAKQNFEQKDLPKGGLPMCPKCFSVMYAVEAKK